MKLESIVDMITGAKAQAIYEQSDPEIRQEMRTRIGAIRGLGLELSALIALSEKLNAEAEKGKDA